MKIFIQGVHAIINTYTQESKRMRCLVSPGIRKMQMKSTMWHHYEPTRTADMKAGEDWSHKNSTREWEVV